MYTKLRTKMVPYIHQRSGVYYYSRRVPKDLSGHYSSQRIVLSLKTKSKRAAVLSSSHLSLELDSYWSSIRIKQIAKRYVKHSTPLSGGDVSEVYLSDALEYYLKLKGLGKSELFHQTANRSIDYVLSSLGDRDLSEYSTADAGKFRDALLKRGLVSSSVKRIFSSVKSIVNMAIKEQGLNISNPFAGIYMPDLDDVKKRKPISIDNIKKIQAACRKEDDDIRWAISLISDTGMRLSEAIGLRREDIVIDGEVPFVVIKGNSKRRLKTKQSERIVPLVGSSLWAAKRLLKYGGDDFLFERYNKGGSTNANSASGALNKWIKFITGDRVVIHSFRHSMRDRLRAVECPSDVIDQIGGWSKGSIGQNYGDGYAVSILWKWMDGGFGQ
jgi:integrase